MAQNLTLRVNGASRTVNVEPDTPLLYILRNDLELNGPRFGCGLSQCGACTVLVDGRPTHSWADYPILTFTEVPAIEVHVINRPDERPLGNGEGSQGPTGAAIANALFNATGVRMRDVPFTPDRVKTALASSSKAA